MSATGVTIDPDISGRDDPTPMLCLVAQLSALFGTHLTGRQECANRRGSSSDTEKEQQQNGLKRFASLVHLLG
jgi:hypothetical protein